MVIAEVHGDESSLLDVLVDLEGNHMAEQRLEKIFEGLAEPERDGLAGGICPVVGFDPCGEIVVAWGSAKAFLNKGV